MTRTSEEILKNPMIGETIQGRYLGYRGYGKYSRFIRMSCPSCGNQHWVINTLREKSRIHCFKCTPRNRLITKREYKPELFRKYHPRAEGKYKTITLLDIPKEGDLIRGSEIERSDIALFRWAICPKCERGRWISRGTRGNPMCPQCGNEFKMNKYIGDRSSRWKGGRIVVRKGYVFIRIRPDNPFFPMANSIGYVAEHRLVIAKHLGRPLKRWEIVHHKHDRYPVGSVEDRQDNRLENLELLPNKCSHDAITTLEKKINELNQKVTDLKTRIKLNEWRIKELETEIAKRG